MASFDDVWEYLPHIRIDRLTYKELLSIFFQSRVDYSS